MYKINWPQSQIKFDRNLGYYLNIKVDPTQPNLYQDGSPRVPGIITYHGTSEIALKSILFSGLKSSTRSHKVMGLWLNDCQQSAVSWNCSLLDQSPCLCCVVNANPAFDRQNAEIMQGQGSRRISELRKDMLLPSVLITDILVAIPHPDRTTWRKKLFQSFCDTYQYLLDLPLQHRLPRDSSNIEWASQLYQLTAARVAYTDTDGAMSSSFGGSFETIPSEMIPISTAVTRLINALQTVSERSRAHKLKRFTMTSIPLPIREVFLQYFPELRVWAIWTNLTVYDVHWTMGTYANVDKWFSV